MTDTDHNRSNNSGTGGSGLQGSGGDSAAGMSAGGAKALDREDELPTPSHSGSAGGGMARDVGKRDEEKAFGEDAGEGLDPSVTGVHRGDKPAGGDEPNPPSRDGNSPGFREQR